ncbi:MAG: F0F1 ATP synthase subunit gamma [Alphaproteobacteria bacterium]|nr:F0F1 ATP synthase subunit gamma [Alphaproteobacteria bacterium]
MASLKDLRNRIKSVQSTRKITSAMKMVAAAKLRRAQEQAEASRPYSERMSRMLGSLAGGMAEGAGGPKLLTGTGENKVHLLVICTAERGLCGGFNGQIARLARKTIADLKADGKTVKLMMVGRKGRDALRRDHEQDFVDYITFQDVKRMGFVQADDVANRVLAMFEAGEFDVCSILYSEFKSVIAQEPTVLQLIPASLPEEEEHGAETGGAKALYEYEPDEEQILEALLPRNLAVQVYRALLENAAGEQGARMTAMDNATRNAGDMINRLTLEYNRTRQAQITKELIEIISGAEAL